jgi:hypothetical protein
MAAAQAESRDSEGAVRTAARINDNAFMNYTLPFALADIAITLERVGRPQEAERVVGRISEYAFKQAAVREVSAARSAVQDPGAGYLPYRTTPMDLLAEGDFLPGSVASPLRTGNTHEALAAAAGLREEMTQAVALRAVAVSQARGGDLTAAIHTAARISNERLRDSAFLYLAETRREKGDFQGALQTASGIRNEAMKAAGLQQIATAQARAGDVQGALSWATAQESALAKTRALLGISLAILDRTDAASPRTIPSPPTLTDQGISPPPSMFQTPGFAR